MLCLVHKLLRLPARLAPTAAPTRRPRLRALMGRVRTATDDGGKGREGRERRGEGEARRARKARGRRRSLAVGLRPSATGAIAACATPNQLLKHPHEISATYV